MNTNSIPSANAGDVVNQIMAAVNAQDISKYLAVQCPEAELVVPGGVTLRGHDSIKDYIQAQWTAFPDGHLTLVNQIVNGDRVATEVVLTGTHTGPLATPNGPVPPTGRSIEVNFVAIHEVRHDKVLSEHVYFDQLGLLTQLGLMPG